jgi:hypothetical protein
MRLMLLALCTGLAPMLLAQQPEVERLQSELKQLRSEIDALKDVQRQGGDDEPALSTKLKNNVFSWSTEDGSFSLTMSNWIQFRLTYNDERAQNAEGPSDPNSVRATNGRDFWNFRVTRANTMFRGNLFAKEWKYFVNLNWTNGGDNIVWEAYLTWAKYKEFNVSAGQTKVPFSFEFIQAYAKLQFVDATVVNETFNQGWGKGLWVSGVIGDDAHTWLKYWVGVFNGSLRGNNDFRNQDRAINSDTFSQTVDADLMPALRVETHPLGQLADDMVDLRGEDSYNKILFSVGFGMNWLTSRFVNPALRTTSTTGGSGRSNTGQDTIAITLDGHFRWHGLSVNVAWYHRHTEFHNFGPLEGNSVTRGRAFPGDLTDNAITFEAGFFILPKKFDVGVRFAMIDADEFWLGGASTKRNAIRPDSTEVGLVVGYYLLGHNLKFQADFTYFTYQLAVAAGTMPTNAPANQGMPNRSPGSIANDTSDYWNIWQFRLQIQWIF